MPGVDGDIILSAGLDTKGVKDGIAKLNKTVNRALKNTMRIVLGVRSVFALIRKLRSALIDGFESLAQVHEPFNRAMSELMTSLQLLKNTFATAFAPIVETVAPILANFINLMSKAVAQVGMFIAALTGKEYVHAGAVQVDYAKSVDKSASSSKKAASATKKQNEEAKKLQKTLMKFDDVNILHDNKENEPNTESQTSVPDVAFKTMPISDAVGKFVKDFKAMWEKADFTDLGRKLGEKLRDALNNIDWEEIKKALRKIASSIATFLNGFLGTPGLFAAIGHTLAEALNSAFEFLNEWVSKFKWDKLGEAIRDLIVNTLNDIDWPLIKDTMTKWGKGVGQAFETGINDPEVWSAIFTTISEAINSVLLFVDNFLNEVNWENLGRNIANGMNDGIETLDWNLLAQTLIDLVNDAFDLWYGWVTTFNFDAFGTHIGQSLSKVITGINWSKGTTNLAKTIDGIFVALYKIALEIHWEEIGRTVIRAIRDFFANLKWKQYGETFTELLSGLLKALLAAVSDPTINWKDVPQYIINAIRSFFSDRGKWEEIANLAIQLLKKAFEAALDILQGFLDPDEVNAPIVDTINDVKESLSELADAIDFPAIASGIKAVVDALKPAVEGFAIGFLEVFDGLLHIGIDFFTALGPALQAIADAIKSIPPEDLKKYGEALGILVGLILSLKGANAAITVFGSFVEKVKSFADIAGGVAVGAKSVSGGISSMGTAAGGVLGALTGVLKFLVNSAGASVLVAYGFNRHVKPSLDGTFDAAIEASDGLTKVTNALYNTTKPGKEVDNTLNQLWQQMLVLNDETPSFEEGFDRIIKSLEDAGVNVDDFKDGLATLLSEGAFNESQAAIIQEYIGNIGTSAKDADTDTSGLSEAIDAFAGLGWTVPLKIALLSGAIDLLASSGKLSKEETEKLHKELDNYKADPTEESMGKVADAFEDAGISAGDFKQAVIDSVQDLKQVFTGSDQFAKELRDAGEDITKLFGDGLVSGVSNSKSNVSKEVKSVGDNDIIGTLQDTLHEHSPSKDAEQIGQYFIEGLILGLEAMRASLITKITTIINEVKNKITSYNPTFKTLGSTLLQNLTQGIQSKQSALSSNIKQFINSLVTDIKSYSSAFNSAGNQLMNDLDSGMGSVESQIKSNVNSLVSSIRDEFTNQDWNGVGRTVVDGIRNGMDQSKDNLYNMASTLGSWTHYNVNNQNWNDIGSNICSGIVNGIRNGWDWVMSWARSLASWALWTAKNELGIASPSKEFAWVGEMVTKGFGNGIADNADNAIDAVTDLTDAMTEEAEKTNPAISLSTSITDWVDDLDYVLTEFSETVIGKFDSLITTLQNLANLSYYGVPDIADGKIIPSSIRTSDAAEETTNSINRLIDSIGSLTTDKITIDQLREILIDVISTYVNFSIGDEQIARHANAGNLRLNRRYSTITS